MWMQQHPNEYIRGATLRSLQKIKDQELLEPLIPLIRSCLVRVVYIHVWTRRQIELIVVLSGTSPFLRSKECRLCRSNPLS